MVDIDLNWHQIVEILITELKEAHNRETTIYDDNWNIDQELIQAIEKVLGYYMLKEDFLRWKNGFGNSVQAS